jgi:rubredoxin
MTAHSLNCTPLMAQYMCLICGFIYDETQGLPEENIPAGTRWADIPDDWACPECGAMKTDFNMIEVTS